MRRQRRSLKLLALIMGLSLVATACGSDDDEGDDAAGEAPEEGVQGGEVVDLSAFAGGPAEHIDPRINTTAAGWQVGGSLYDD